MRTLAESRNDEYSRKKKKEEVKSLIGKDRELLYEIIEEDYYGKRKGARWHLEDRAILWIPSIFVLLILTINFFLFKLRQDLSIVTAFDINSLLLVLFASLYIIILLKLRRLLKWNDKFHYGTILFFAFMQIIMTFLFLGEKMYQYNFIQFVGDIRVYYIATLFLMQICFWIFHLNYPYFLQKPIQPKLGENTYVYVADFSEEKLEMDGFSDVLERWISPYSIILKINTEEKICRVFRLFSKEFAHLGVILKNSAIAILLFDADQELHQSDETKRKHAERAFELRSYFSLKHANRQISEEMIDEMKALLVLFSKRLEYVEEIVEIPALLWKRKLLYGLPILLLILLIIGKNILFKAIENNPAPIIAAIITSLTSVYIFNLASKRKQ
jgi:hypothetical protein